MQISKCETIVDEKKFVESHTATVERNKDNKWFESYKKRGNYICVRPRGVMHLTQNYYQNQ